MKAIVLLSGGLDSQLAVRMLQEQGVELEAVNFTSIFSASCSRGKNCSVAVSAAREHNIPLKVYDMTEELMGFVENPSFGHGSAINPCIDCRLFMLIKAREYMLKSGAGFIATGEVLGERPMSQRKDAMKLVEKRSGLEGLLLRPLSAKLLEPTMPEIKGWVDRGRLLDIKGKSRRPQIKLARQLGVGNYSTPAGGCLLTDKEFSRRVKDLIGHKEWNSKNAELLKYGRHFRIDRNCKLAIGRNEEENMRIKDLQIDSDFLLDVKNRPGPTALIKGRPSDAALNIACELTAYFVTKRNKADKIKIEITASEINKTIEILPLVKEKLFKYRI